MPVSPLDADDQRELAEYTAWYESDLPKSEHSLTPANFEAYLIERAEEGRQAEIQKAANRKKVADRIAEHRAAVAERDAILSGYIDDHVDAYHAGDAAWAAHRAAVAYLEEEHRFFLRDLEARWTWTDDDGERRIGDPQRHELLSFKEKYRVFSEAWAWVTAMRNAPPQRGTDAWIALATADEYGEWEAHAEIDSRAEVAHTLAVAERMERLRIDEEAKRLFATERAIGIELPRGKSLTDFLALPLAEEEFVIEGVLQADGNAMLGAQRKAGKTTTSLNVVRSLVDGDAFLDHFPVLARRRVALLNVELSEGMSQRWLARQGIRNTDAVTVFNLRGKARSFDIRDDKTRARWADLLAGAEVLILDPLRPVIDALGINEWNEVGPFLQAFDALKGEAGIREGLIAQHHGHHAERAAGDSRLEGWPDSIWSLTRDDPDDPRSFRYFSAYGRDVDVDKGLVSLYGNDRLAFAADARSGKNERLLDLIADALRERGEMKADDIAGLGIRGVSKNTVRALLEAGITSSRITVRTGEKNAKFYGVHGVPA